METILKIFQDPFPLEDNPGKLFKNSLLISGFVVLFLFFFRPFGLSEVEGSAFRMILIFIGYGAVTFLISFLADRIIKPAFPHFFDEVGWTVGKHIVWVIFIIMMIGLGNLFYSHTLGFTGISGTSILQFQFFTILVAIFPVTIITLISRVTLLNRNLKIAVNINENLQQPISESATVDMLVFNSENGKDELRLNADQFLFAESADNYTDVVYVENSIVRRALIRSSLKRLEEMNTVDYVIRVHRTFIANLRKVKMVSGNSQGYRLGYENMEETIPVSRRSTQSVKELLARIHGSGQG